MKFFNKKQLAAAVLTGALAFGSMQAEAATNFFAEVPSGDWSYSAVNELINSGNVPGYNQPIPSGRVLSRLEMAMIVDEAQKNAASFDAAQKAQLDKLAQEYFYDIKKVQLLNRINTADEKTLERLGNSPTDANGDVVATSETEGGQKVEGIASRLTMTGYARIRHDHLIADTWTPNPTAYTISLSRHRCQDTLD